VNTDQTTLTTTRSQRIGSYLAGFRDNMQPPQIPREGRLTRMVGLTLEATGCQASVGKRCHILSPEGNKVSAEVVGFTDDRTFLMPVGDIHGLTPGSRVVPLQGEEGVSVGDALLGRVIDGEGNPLDNGGSIITRKAVPLVGRPINPLHRRSITEPMDVGIRAINALLTVGRGQRMGLFAGSGIGKSTLLGVMTRHTDADVVVVGLIGERGREVQEFVDNNLGKEGMAKAIVIATPADSPPLMRIHGAWRATAIAEYYRSQGKNVLLLMDSLTRFAQAQREIALAIGEPPVARGFPPSVFAKLPKLVERAGNGNGEGGSITAFYTVLVEGDDHNEPITDAARAILDGHIVLSRRIADAGIYPSIDIESSVSRSMASIVDPSQVLAAREFKKLSAIYEHNRDLINLGAYQAGSDNRIDRAIELQPHLQHFLQQPVSEKISMADSLNALQNLAHMWQPSQSQVQ